MSHRFFISILYSKGAKILAPFEYVIYEENQIGFQWRLWPSKILAYFNLKHKMERTECAPKDDFGPAQAVGRSQTRPVESLGTHSVHLHTLYLNISTKIFISFKLHFLNLFNNIWCFLVYVIVQPIRK